MYSVGQAKLVSTVRQLGGGIQTRRFAMKHVKSLTKPAKAQSEFVCGTYTPTGKTKCVPSGSPKASKIEDIPVP